MEKINIICVDDQPEVLDSVLRDLRPLNSCFRLEGVESASECRELLEEFDQDGELTGLIISDHVMPGGSGVESLGGIAKDDRFAGTRKILLTGQATHADTIQAVNDAHIDNYLEKPSGIPPFSLRPPANCSPQVHHGQGHRPYALYVLPGPGHSAGLPAEKLTGLEGIRRTLYFFNARTLIRDGHSPALRQGQETKPLTVFMFDILLHHNTLVLFGIIFFGIALGSIRILPD